MFNKYKKKILLILTLVFLFNFSFSYKRAEASVIAAAGIGLAVVLLVGAGVAITSPGMAKDLGSRLWEDMKEVVELPSKVGDFFKVQVTGAMLEFVAKWLNDGNVPTAPVENVVTENITLPYTFDFEYPIKRSISFPEVKAQVGKSFTIDLYADGQKVTYTPHTYTEKNVNQPVNGIEFDFYESEVTPNRFHWSGKMLSDGVQVNTIGQAPRLSYDTKQLQIKIRELEGASATVGNITTIPYSPDVSSGASEEKLTTSLPVGSTVTYPSDLTTNFPATMDKPISNVTDIPNVNVDTNVSTDTGVIEGTLTNIAELLQSLVNAITNIFVPPAEDLVNIDLSPLYVGITDKFPFSVPFDLIKTFQNMSDSSKAPKFEVKFPEKYFGSYTFTIDFEQFNDFVLILRYFLLLSFIVFLILQTRNIIGG